MCDIWIQTVFIIFTENQRAKTYTIKEDHSHYVYVTVWFLIADGDSVFVSVSLSIFYITEKTLKHKLIKQLNINNYFCYLQSSFQYHEMTVSHSLNFSSNI
jgi:hypothetical protein